jgi:DNA-binding XRE family transcriptional regulator
MSIKDLRVNAGLLQTDVAKKLHIDQTAVSHWETGKTKPFRKYHKRLARMYGCTVEELRSCFAKKDDDEQ